MDGGTQLILFCWTDKTERFWRCLMSSGIYVSWLSSKQSTRRLRRLKITSGITVNRFCDRISCDIITLAYAKSCGRSHILFLLKSNMCRFSKFPISGLICERWVFCSTRTSKSVKFVISIGMSFRRVSEIERQPTFWMELISLPISAHWGFVKISPCFPFSVWKERFVDSEESSLISSSTSNVTGRQFYKISERIL